MSNNRIYCTLYISPSPLVDRILKVSAALIEENISTVLDPKHAKSSFKQSISSQTLECEKNGSVIGTARRISGRSSARKGSRARG